jgi:hypothetical protein
MTDFGTTEISRYFKDKFSVQRSIQRRYTSISVPSDDIHFILFYVEFEDGSSGSVM